jgi:hypothetical protein
MRDKQYTFGDETRLKLAFDFGNGQGSDLTGGPGDGTIQTKSNNTASRAQFDETLNTAWKYPIDTDGNGKFDSFTIYGLFWRSPGRDPNDGAKFARGRVPLEARSIPQETVGVSNACKSAGQSAATTVGSSDWYQQGGNLSKAFYAYAVTVPITDVSKISPSPFPAAQYEPNKKKDRAFSGLEYEQDRYRAGLNNNAVWYQNDLVLNPGSNFRLNGRVFTNSNLLLGGKPGNGKVRFYQVSSEYSCFYQKENAQINVGGQVGTGDLSKDANQEPATADLFKGYGSAPVPAELNGSTRSTSSQGGNQIAFNDAAYDQRIALMKEQALSFCSGCDDSTDAATIKALGEYSDPDFQKSYDKALDTNKNQTPYKILQDQIEVYLRNHTRGVPYAEVPSPDGDGALSSYTPTNVFAASTVGGMEPPPEWREPLTGSNLTGTSITLNSGNLPQTNPQGLKIEERVGDRVNVGNNLPALWKDTDGKYKGQNQERQNYNGTTWTAGGGTRYRTTQVQALENLGVTERGGFWEQTAAANSVNSGGGGTGTTGTTSGTTGTTSGGGLRIITGAGIYADSTTFVSSTRTYPEDTAAAFLRDTSDTPSDPAVNSFLPAPRWDTQFVDPTKGDVNDPSKKLSKLDPVSSDGADPNAIPKFQGNNHIIVWPDLMPMTDDTKTRKGDLLMRATAVYHYVDGATASSLSEQTPIACVSSYYDPTDANTATNQIGLPDVSGDTTLPPSPESRSNNGVVYDYPGRDIATYQAQLLRQARLVFPDGRIVNQPLRDALDKTPAEYTLADASAIDTAICALYILQNPTAFNGGTVIPHGAIKESSFLDGREVRAIDKLRINETGYDLAKNFDLPLEQRQPQEVRVTDIDLGQLASTAYNAEYLLPYSGIIYASRDDALPDLSNIYVKQTDGSIQVNLKNADKTLSSTDFRLDPTRRPNGIRVINGLRLARGAPGENTYRVQEKGLILVSDLPAYVKGHMNLHLSPGTTTFKSGDDKELEEFKTALDVGSWSLFYGRRDDDLERRFACRQSQTGCDGAGDQWRPATIIADSMTLQSVNYKEGYRNQGDFDLRNNSGNVLAGARASQGFFDNSFVTSAGWGVGGTLVPQDPYKVSYLVNGVTPIQRRANVTAFAMEICPVLPVSKCGAADWTTADAGDTASPPAADKERFARRVAFERNPSGSYYYDSDGLPIPTSTAVQPNALWFKMRNYANPTAPVDDFSGTGYGTTQNKLFIFHPPELPDLGPLRGYAAVDTANAKAVPLKPDLSPITQTEYSISLAPPTPVTTQLTQIIAQFNNLTALPLVGAAGTRDINAVPSNQKTALTGGGEMVVYERPGGLVLSPTNKLRLVGDAGSVFVFRIKGSLSVEQGSLVLGNVLPENVYWIVDNRFTIRITPLTNPNVPSFAGNVLSGGNIRLNANPPGTRVAILEGRAFSTAGAVQLIRTSSIVPPAGNHPRLVPILQIHSPDGVPAPGPNLLPGDPTKFPPNWLQQAESTNYNIASVVGDSPNRPDEQSAGLNNLVRLHENWEGKTLTIKGSFIQQKRSSVAAAPFAAIRLGGQEPKVPPSGTSPETSLSFFGYPNPRYMTSNGTPAGSLPYYNAPATREWGFDVGLLSQQPDLFSQRFTTDISKVQSYYRQVGRDDDWVKTLLCAAEPAGSTSDERTGQAGTNYTQYAVSDSERPDCKRVTNVDLPYPPNS